MAHCPCQNDRLAGVNAIELVLTLCETVKNIFKLYKGHMHLTCNKLDRDREAECQPLWLPILGRCQAKLSHIDSVQHWITVLNVALRVPPHSPQDISLLVVKELLACFLCWEPGSCLTKLTPVSHPNSQPGRYFCNKG